MVENLSKFSTPKVFINPDGWGPTETNLPNQFLNLPFAPFGKSDRIGRAADFTTSMQFYNRSNRSRRLEDAIVNENLQYRFNKEDEAQFELVDTTRSVTGRSRYSGVKNRWLQNQKARGGGREGRGGRGSDSKAPQIQPRSGKDRARLQPQGKKKWNLTRKNDHRQWNRRYQRNDRQASVKIQADWQIVEEFDLASLSKASTAAPSVTDLKWCGFLNLYDDLYDHVTSRKSKKLLRHENKEFYFVTTTDDPVIEEFAVEPEFAGAVFATDAILSHLMAAPRSMNPWDIVIQKVGDSIFLDKRDNSQFDFLTVNETATDVPIASEDPENINHPDRLSLEATMINQNFSQQILKEDEREDFSLPNPFFAEEDGANDNSKPASIAYRYRQFSFGSELKFVVRCELHGIVKKSGKKLYMTAYALNEWDSKLAGTIEWRQKLDTQKGAVLATEIKNNSAKLAKWTAQSLLAGADQMKIGFVSRSSKINAYEHVILGTQFYHPTDFARQITMDQRNMWGIVMEIIGLVRKQNENGKYVLMKDPNKPVLRLYNVPLGTFEDDEEENDEEEQDDEQNNDGE